MKLERRVPAPESRNAHVERRDAAQATAEAMFPNAQRIDLGFHGGRYLAFPWHGKTARAHEVEL